MLNIPTKITKGSVEITADVHLIKTGDKVRRLLGLLQRGACLAVAGHVAAASLPPLLACGSHNHLAAVLALLLSLLLTRLLPAPPHPQQVGASEATLLSKLGIKPFSYGLVILQVYDSGSLYDPKVRQRAHMMAVALCPTWPGLPPGSACCDCCACRT